MKNSSYPALEPADWGLKPVQIVSWTNISFFNLGIGYFCLSNERCLARQQYIFSLPQYNVISLYYCATVWSVETLIISQDIHQTDKVQETDNSYQKVGNLIIQRRFGAEWRKVSNDLQQTALSLQGDLSSLGIRCNIYGTGVRHLGVQAHSRATHQILSLENKKVQSWPRPHCKKRCHLAPVIQLIKQGLKDLWPSRMWQGTYGKPWENNQHRKP